MKSTSSRLISVMPFLAAVVGLLMAAGQNAFASAEDHVDDGLTVSKTWVALIDAGQYDDSYASSSGEMRDKVPQDRWTAVLKAIRGSWGAMVSRRQLSHVYKANGFEGSEGEFLVITYDTSFQRLPAATELVVLRWEDGHWRGAGYNAGPKPAPDSNTAADPGQDNSTEVQTQEHVKPMPQ
jgi:hypothetical protein